MRWTGTHICPFHLYILYDLRGGVINADISLHKQREQGIREDIRPHSHTHKYGQIYGRALTFLYLFLIKNKNLKNIL